MRTSKAWLLVACSLVACGGGGQSVRIEGTAEDTGGVVVEGTEEAHVERRRARAEQAPRMARCPESNSSVFVLYFDPQRGTLEPAHPGAYPVGGQRIVVCVTDPDWRDIYSVSTSDTVEPGATGAASRDFTVGGTDALAAPGQQVDTRGGQAAARGGGQLRCADTIARGAVFLETHRSNFMRRLVNVLGGRLGPAQVARLREALDNYRYPRNPEDAPPGANCPPNEVEGGARCSLESYVNVNFLPTWLWLADGEWLFNAADYESGSCARSVPPTDPQAAAEPQATAQAGGAAPTEFVPGLPPHVRPAIGALARSIERAAAVAELAEALLADIEQPETVFDLGTFGGNHLAIITVSRHRRTLILRGGTARLEWRARRTVRRQEIHALSTFRLEPGFAFSLLRRPTFGVESTPNGDQVIALRDEGLRLVEPAVWVSFYWCGQDLRVNPWERSCHGHEGDAGWWILAHLPSIAVGIPINADLFSERASFFVGLLLDWIPYVSIGVGAHIGLSVPTLRENVLLGDPLAGRPLEELIENRPQVSGYLSLSMSIDAFQQLAGFQVAR